MTVACYPLDAVAGSPEYTGRMLRDTLSALVGGASAARPFGAFSGVRPGTPAATVTLSGLNWTCEPHAGVLDVQAAGEAGPYLYAVMTDETGTLNAQAVGNARSDLLVAQLSDPAEADGTTVPEVEIVYVPGTAGPGAPDPATPARSMVLGRFNVPQSGGGSPTFTWLAPSLYAAGARALVLTQAALATLEEYSGMEATVAATPGAFWRYNGSAWVMHGTAQFASTAARDAAITTPADGMLAYTSDTKSTWLRDASTWKLWSRPRTAFTPTFTGIVLGGGGTATAYLTVSEGWAFIDAYLTLGTAPTVGNTYLNAPAGASMAGLPGRYPLGDAIYSDTSLTNRYRNPVQRDPANDGAQLQIAGSSGLTSNLSSTTPFTWANTDEIMVNLRYPIA
jgi:hypothetical protein